MPSAVKASARSVGSRVSRPSTVRRLLRSLWIMGALVTGGTWSPATVARAANRYNAQRIRPAEPSRSACLARAIKHDADNHVPRDVVDLFDPSPVLGAVDCQELSRIDTDFLPPRPPVAVGGIHRPDFQFIANASAFLGDPQTSTLAGDHVLFDYLKPA